MGIKVTVDTIDLKKLTAQCKAAPKSVRSELYKGQKEVGQKIADGAKEIISPLSPEIAADIKVKRQGLNTIIVQGGSKDHPIGKLEEGNGKPGFWEAPNWGRKDKHAQARHPHLLPSFNQHKEEASTALQEHVKHALDTVGLESAD